MNKITSLLRKIYWNLASSKWDNYLEETSYRQELDLKAEYLRSLFEKNNPTAIDICCGTGSLSHALAEKGFKVTGVDYAARMLKKAEEKNFSNVSLQPCFFESDINRSFEFPGKYDLIVCHHCFFGIEDRHGFIKKAYNASSLGGYLYIVVKRISPEEKLRPKEMHRSTGIVLGFLKPFLFSGGRFSDDELGEIIKMISSSGFTLVEEKASPRNYSILFKKA